MKKTILAILFVMIGTLTASSQINWKIDPAHSNIIFTVSHMVISEVSGSFHEFEATLLQPENDLAGSKLTAKIKVNSIDTDNEGRDKHLRSADFFETEKYPVITFTSKTFEKLSDNKYKITGDLTMRGITKAVVLDVKYNGQMTDPWGNTKAGFKATTNINRKDFGLTWNKTLDAGGLLVGEDISININAEMVKEKNK